jgi:hypothetical protein
MNLRNRWLVLGVGFIVLSACATLYWWQKSDRTEVERSSAIQQLDSPATARLGREMRQLLSVLDSLERGDTTSSQRCERCSYLSQAATGYRARAAAALQEIRYLEATLSMHDESRTPAQSTTLERALADRQAAAGRAIAGLRSFADAASACELEKLCTRDDEARSIQTSPVDCARDRDDIAAAAARISSLADSIIVQARFCQTIACPVMDCDRSAALVDDLEIAEVSLAEMAGGRTAWPGGRTSSPSKGLVTVLGGVERALVRLALDSAEATLPPSAISARASDMLAGLSGWLQRMETRRGVEKESWRVSALMGEIDVASEWALRGDTVEYTRAYYEALSRAMLSAARLDAALSMSEEPNADKGGATGGPLCGVSDLATAYLKAGRATAALGFCRAKSACAQTEETNASRRPFRSASDEGISALAAVIGALPLGVEREADARVSSSPSAQISMSRADYVAGEVMTVTADASPSACLINGGAIGLGPAGVTSDREQRYQLQGNTRSEILLAAPDEPGLYVVRVFASADRGGQVLSEHAVTIVPLGPGCDGFTGMWDTQFGRLRMVERDGYITGSYRKSAEAVLPGLILGERSGRTLTGTWLSELGRGGTSLRLQADGTHFRGTWGVRPERATGGGAWNGECLGR